MSQSTPMMKQYLEIKREHPDAILFFRMGDFYEMFGDDAVKSAKAMNIALTTRDKNSDNPTAMCGVPYHALATYLPKMIDKGFKVAICEQVEDPKTAKGIVKRQVVRVVTPGTVVEPALLDDKAYNFLATVAPSKRGFGLALADYSTGLFRVCEFIGDRALLDLEYELGRAGPKQILVPDNIDSAHPPLSRMLASELDVAADKIDVWNFGLENARNVLLSHFNLTSLDGFGIEMMDQAICAAGATITYLRDTQKESLEHIGKIVVYNPSDSMTLDPATQRNLELAQNLTDGTKEGTLLSVMDDTKTAMGGRTLNEWIIRPLVSVDQIIDRQDVVKCFFDNDQLFENVRDVLSSISDLERISGRVTLKSCAPRDLLSLCRSINPLPELHRHVTNIETTIGRAWVEKWDDLSDLRALLEKAISDEPPAFLRDGGAIRKGFSDTLDELRSVQSDSRSLLLQLEERERQRTGITGLKVKFNKVYGYFIEVSRRHAEQVPDEWMRKQSLVNTERFVSSELKELEEKIVTAQERAMELELELFEKVRAQAAEQVQRVQEMSQIVGQLDALCSLSSIATKYGYVAPTINDGSAIEIKSGRHPVIERIDLSERFVPNDATLDCSKAPLSIVTGPNMAGKSTYIRQVAAITLMAQIGSFVPADSATIGVADRIFTRVGAQDHLRRGQSTFMVEMNETALILNNATGRSLIILDEIGRGTSTFDGISIAWAVAEYIGKLGARTLFATHYHELTELAVSMEGVRNLSVAVKEWNDEIIFLRKIVEEGADKSYGIQVARLAGLPREVIQRAGEILSQLEANELDASGKPKLKARDSEQQFNPQADLFTSSQSEVEEELRKIDLNALTPIEALNLLAKLKEKL